MADKETGKKRISVFLILSLLFLFFLPRLFSLQAEDPLKADRSLPFYVLETDELLKKMSDEQLLGQVLMLGFPGNRPIDEFIRWVGSNNIGGIKIFGWNSESLPELAEGIALLQKELQESALGIPLIVSTDQEGGWVRHVKGKTSITPGNLAIGATGRPIDAYNTGFYIGEELRALGINMNLAPTVDIYSNPEAHVIGPRAFSDDPLSTSMLAMAYGKGLEKKRVIWTAKHFPGHGNSAVDSHGSLPLIDTEFETLWETDLLPYRYLIRENLPAILVGHLAFPAVTDSTIPATFSSFFIQDLLKEQMGFSGIVVSDDLIMGGALEQVRTVEEAAIRAIEAGTDSIMISRTFETQKRVWSVLLDRMKKNPPFKERIRDAAARVLTVKAAYLKNEDSVPLYPDIRTIPQSVPSKEGENFFFDLACRSVTVIKSEYLPLEEPGKTLLVGQFSTFIEEGLRRFPGADTFYFAYSPFYSTDTEAAKKIISMANKYDTIIFCLSNPNSLGVLKTLKDSDTRLVVFSVLTPVYLREVPWVRSAIAVYGTGTDSFQAGFAAIKGDFIAEGLLPLILEN